MHIPAKFVLFGLMPLAIYSCHSPSDEIVKTFDSVNKSLIRSNKVISASDSLAYYHLSIDAKFAGDTARKADSLYAATLDALKLFDQAKTRLRATDSSDYGTHAATALFVHTSLGDSIRSAVTGVARLCHESLMSPDKHKSLDELLHSSLEIVRDHWDGTFTGEPNVAALTILSYFQSRCTKAAVFTLADINTHTTHRP